MLADPPGKPALRIPVEGPRTWRLARTAIWQPTSAQTARTGPTGRAKPDGVRRTAMTAATPRFKASMTSRESRTPIHSMAKNPTSTDPAMFPSVLTE